MKFVIDKTVISDEENPFENNIFRSKVKELHKQSTKKPSKRKTSKVDIEEIGGIKNRKPILKKIGKASVDAMIPDCLNIDIVLKERKRARRSETHTDSECSSESDFAEIGGGDNDKVDGKEGGGGVKIKSVSHLCDPNSRHSNASLTNSIRFHQLCEANISQRSADPITAIDFDSKSARFITASLGTNCVLFALPAITPSSSSSFNNNNNSKEMLETPPRALHHYIIERFPIRSAAFTADNRQILLASNKYFFKMVDIESGAITHFSRLPKNHKICCDVAISPDNRLIALGTLPTRGPPALFFVSRLTFNVCHMHTLPSPATALQFVATAIASTIHLYVLTKCGQIFVFSSGGGGDASSSGSLTLQHCITAAPKLVAVLDESESVGGCGGGAARISMSVSRDSHWLAVGSEIGLVHLFDISRLHYSLLAATSSNHTATQSQSDNKTNCTWNASMPPIAQHYVLPEATKIIKNLEAAVDKLEFSSNGKFLALLSSHQPNGVRLFNMAALQVYENFPGKRKLPVCSCVRISADCRHLMIGLKKGSVASYELF